ncbi:TlpA disulfide reductase family protein [Streptomyces sp. NBC_00091]|uniref:TlpA family protein disulfide reductase n=1 Tax=Streptomyces sp. NBC_00091 TaxID=2975648 RepID=UPI00224FD5BA|nr:TlpA disulfide reductase family protein [Streptomyces sp. NBC_00091]MCX5380293.1 TlpA family protein disulfide reductase [Streptomyces sp. NBC_00091]
MRRRVRTAVSVPVGAGLSVAVALTLTGIVTDDSGAGAAAGTRTVAATPAAGAVVAAPQARPSAPALTGSDLDGRPVSLSAFRGEVVVLNVWGSWCAPCRAEADELVLLSGQVRGEGVRFLGINTRDRDRDAARSFVRAHGLGFPSLHDPTGALLLRFPPAVLNPRTIPSTLVLDRGGRVAVAIGGAVSAEQLRPLVARVAAEG